MAVWLRAKPMGRTLCGFVRQHAYGNADTLPDHARIAWMLALITINMDLSVPVLYTAIIETSYGCNMFTLYGIYYGISQANFAMPVVCGWTSDWLGPWSHVVLLVCCVILSLLQAATLVVTDVWLLGAIFVVRQWLINQAVVQSYKLMAIRAHKVQLNPHVCCVRAVAQQCHLHCCRCLQTMRSEKNRNANAQARRQTSGRRLARVWPTVSCTSCLHARPGSPLS